MVRQQQKIIFTQEDVKEALKTLSQFKKKDANRLRALIMQTYGTVGIPFLLTPDGKLQSVSYMKQKLRTLIGEHKSIIPGLAIGASIASVFAFSQVKQSANEERTKGILNLFTNQQNLNDLNTRMDTYDYNNDALALVTMISDLYNWFVLKRERRQLLKEAQKANDSHTRTEFRIGLALMGITGILVSKYAGSKIQKRHKQRYKELFQEHEDFISGKKRHTKTMALDRKIEKVCDSIDAPSAQIFRNEIMNIANMKPDGWWGYVPFTKSKTLNIMHFFNPMTGKPRSKNDICEAMKVY